MDVPLSMLADKQQLILWQEMDILWAIQRTQMICSLLIAAHCSAFFSNSRPSDLADVKIWRYVLAKTSAISLSLTYPSTEFTVFLLTLLIFFNSVNYGLAPNTQSVITWTIEYYRSSAINQYYFFGPQWVKHVPIVENCGGMEKNVRFLTVQLHTHVLINVGAYGQTFSIS